MKRIKKENHKPNIIKFCMCKKCEFILINHILNMINKKILEKQIKLLGKKINKSI